MGKDKDDMVTYTLRVDRDRWALFGAITALKNTSVLDALRGLIDGYIRDNGGLLSSAAEEAAKKSESN